MANEMREPTFLLLTALARGPLHGYALIQAVEKLSDGRVRLRPGTLYGAIDRLCRDGQVDFSHEEVVDGRLRRYYRISRAGTDALRTETMRLRANAARATKTLKAIGVTV